MININFFLSLLFLLFCKGYVLCATYDSFCEYDGPYCDKKNNRLICSQGLHEPFTNGSLDVNELILCHWSAINLNLSHILSLFGRVESIEIRKSSISHVNTRDANTYTSLKRLNLSNIHLKNVSLTNLPSLISLDLSNNLIKKVKQNDLIGFRKLRNINLAGNPLNCSSDILWLLDLKTNQSINFTDEERTLCSNEIYPNKPIFVIMEFYKKMKSDCPETCKCTLDRVVGEELIPIITVDCNNLGLTEFPKKIPVNTTILLLKHNKISSMTQLVTDKQYWEVKDVFLDHNLLLTIDDSLEGSYWLNNFRVLSVRENLITHVHTYSLDNAFERNHNLIRVYFGSNPWSCDCAFTPHFKGLLLKYQKQMKDINDVRCNFQDGDENSMLLIAELPITAVCTDHSLPLHPLDYLSIAFATANLLILGKLGYDWWHFKRTGKVPWIVANMP